MVWKCPECGKVDREQWFGGSHMRLGGSDTTDPEQRCYGQAGGPFYLLSQDEYLDVLLAGGVPGIGDSDISRILAERNLYRSALERIVACDYRGNEPHEQHIAREALRG